MMKSKNKIVAIFSIEKWQWTEFQDVMEDSDTNFETWEEWNESTENLRTTLEEHGIESILLKVNLKEFQIWCAENNRNHDGKARAAFVNRKLNYEE